MGRGAYGIRDEFRRSLEDSSLQCKSRVPAEYIFCARDAKRMYILSLPRPAPLCVSAIVCLSHQLASHPCRVYKNMEELRTRIASGIISPLGVATEKVKKESQAEKKDPVSPQDYNPLGIPPRHPAGTRAPSW